MPKCSSKGDGNLSWDTINNNLFSDVRVTPDVGDASVVKIRCKKDDVQFAVDFAVRRVGEDLKRTYFSLILVEGLIDEWRGLYIFIRRRYLVQG